MFHRVSIIGRLTADPEMRYTPGGAAVTNFNVASNKRISKERNGETVECPTGWKETYNGKGWEFTIFWRCTAWRGLAKSVNEYKSKGDEVYVEGEINGTVENGVQNPRVWEGKDGVSRASFEVTAQSVRFIGGQSQGGAPTPEEPPAGLAENDDIPF